MNTGLACSRRRTPGSPGQTTSMSDDCWKSEYKALRIVKVQRLTHRSDVLSDIFQSNRSVEQCTPSHASKDFEVKHSIVPPSRDDTENSDRPSGFDEAGDSFGNKGFSSVSLQSVHAIGSLPVNLDGATDRQTAQALLASASRVRSPRLIRRVNGNGGA